MRFKEVLESSGLYEDEHGRFTTTRVRHIKEISINPNAVVGIEPIPSVIIESEGGSPRNVCKITTTNGTHIVVGSHLELESKVFGDKRKILKG